MSEYTGPLYVSVDYDTGPFAAAENFTADTRTMVRDQFNYIKDTILGQPGSIDSDTGDFLVTGSSNILGYATDAINALKGFDFGLEELVTTYPELNWEFNWDTAIDPPNKENFGAITPYSLGNAPNPSGLPSISDVTIPTFTSSIDTLDIPSAPDPTLIPDPGDAPDSPGFSYPDSPVVTLPDRPLLETVNIPSYVPPTIPTWEDITFPVLEPMNINTYINWSEPAYSPEIWTDVKTQLQSFFAGGSGIRPEVEEALVARGRDREDRLVRQQEMQAVDEWAGRGYTAPPGMLVKRLDNIREEGLIKKLGLQREVVIKAMDEELANIRLAVQQGIAAEQLFVQIHLAAVERLFLIERLHVEWEIQKYNLLVEAFKAKFEESRIRAEVFEVRVRAALAEIEIFKALIDAERVKAEINTTLIQAYRAEIEARESIVNLYKAQVEAVGIQAGVFETEVKAYGEEVAAYATRVNADKLRFDAYESRVRGEMAKASIVEAEARAYQAEVDGIGTGVRAEAAALEGAVSAFQAEVSAYEAQLRGHAARSATELAALQGNVAGYQADTQRYVAQAGAEEAKARVELGAWEAENRLELGWFETEIKKFETETQKIINQKNLILDALKAAGDLASTIGAGALAAMHAGATVTGSSGITGSGSESRTVSINDAWSRTCSTDRRMNITYESDTVPSLECDFV